MTKRTELGADDVPLVAADAADHPGREQPRKKVSRRASNPSRFSIVAWMRGRVAALFAASFDLLTLGLIAGAALVAAILAELPDTNTLRDVQLQEPLRVYTADGALMAQFGAERRSPVDFKDVPPLLVKAFLATEDSRFFEHDGVDITGIGRAAINYLKTGERSQGGSTITMQVARNFFLSPEKTFQRKFAELLLAMHIERTLTKQEILETLSEQDLLRTPGLRHLRRRRPLLQQVPRRAHPPGDGDARRHPEGALREQSRV